MVKRNEAAELADIEQQYRLRDEPEVRRYLRRYPLLVPLLHEAHAEIARCFGSDQQVTLEVIEDPEIENHRKVFALIQTDLDPEKALNHLHCFDTQWWLPQSHRAQGALNFDLEFA